MNGNHESTAAATPPTYWTTLEQYHQTPEYLARRGEEFFPGAKPENILAEKEANGTLEQPIERRTFFKLSGIAALVATLAACERPVSKIIPHTTVPEGLVPGIPAEYATTCGACSAACGVIALSREGRPTKLEGNKAHPVNKGALCATAQASLLSLYNPDRLRAPLELGRREKGTAIADPTVAEARIGASLANAGGRVVLLTSTLNGPSHERFVADLKRAFPKLEHVAYEPLNSGAIEDAYDKLYGGAQFPRFRFDRARTVVLLGGDPTGMGASKVEYHRGISSRRNPGKDMSRIYAFEAVPTMSGTTADYRYPVKAAALPSIALALANEIVNVKNASAVPVTADLKAHFAKYDAASVEKNVGIAAGTIAKIAERLIASKGESLLYCDGTMLSAEHGQALALTVALLNGVLGNDGRTIDRQVGVAKKPHGSQAEISKLIAAMNAGEVEALIVWGVNPAYTLPPTADFHGALKQVKLVVSLSPELDETAVHTDYVFPGQHWLETWGDTEPQAGLFGLRQPLIAPIFEKTRCAEETLIAFAVGAGSSVFDRDVPAPADATTETLATWNKKAPTTWYQYVRETWQQYHKDLKIAATYEDFWVSAVRQGIIDRRGKTVDDEKVHDGGSPAAVDSALLAAPALGGDFELNLYGNGIHGDGVSMTMPYLPEVPDPVTRIAWDNFLGMSAQDADAGGWAEGDWATVQGPFGKMELPVFIWPGVAKGSLAVMLGWGRTHAGEIAKGVGFNAYPLAGAKDGKVLFSAIAGTKIERITTGLEERNALRHGMGAANVSVFNKLKRPAYPFANTQGHNYLEGRPIFFETTLHQWEKDPKHGVYNHWGSDEFRNMWGKEHKYAGHHWGMAIDYNKCNACGACLVACSAENNVPVVGKADVIKGREMHWIRIDRYYRGTPENPDHVYQPMLCQQCGTAPCETVCPVIATLHNDEGLNTMIYNRCVGTRYCSNNCPYKVRRFNWFTYADYRNGFHGGVKREAPLELALNPDVTVRRAGVMEKCTFCVHKIKRAKERARERGLPMQDGDMETACQTTCPGKAIVFGDRNDPNSELMKLWKDDRAHGVLVDLNTQPGIRYLTLVRNRDEDVPVDYLGAHGGHDDHGHDHDHGHGEEKKDGHSAAPATAGASHGSKG